VLVVANTNLQSIYTVVFAAIAVVVWSATCEPDGPQAKVNVPAEAAVLVTAMLVTTVVVDAGTV